MNNLIYFIKLTKNFIITGMLIGFTCTLIFQAEKLQETYEVLYANNVEYDNEEYKEFIINKKVTEYRQKLEENK